MLLYAVTDRTWLNGKMLSSQVEEAIIGGATFIQLREKNLNYSDFLNEAIEIRKICNKYKIPFVIDDNVEIALKNRIEILTDEVFRELKKDQSQKEKQSTD